MAKENRGFASMDRNKQRAIASKGGRVAHEKGTAHEWTPEEAREAGRKGVVASRRFGAAAPKATPTTDEQRTDEPGTHDEQGTNGDQNLAAGHLADPSPAPAPAPRDQ